MDGEGRKERLGVGGLSDDGSRKFGKQQLIFIEIGRQTVGIGRQSPFGSRNYLPVSPCQT